MSEQAIPSKFAGLTRLGKSHGRYLWIAGLLLYLGIIAYIGFEDIGSALRTLDYRYIAALMLIEASALAIRAWKWRIALGPNQQSLRACFISKAGGNLTPARLGEFSPLLLKEHRSARVGAWILLDRLLEASATILIGLVGLIAILGLAGGGTLAAWALAILATLGFATYLFSNQRFMSSLSARFKPTGLPGRTLHLLQPVSREMSQLGPKTPLLISMTLGATILDLILGYLLFMCFGIGLALTVLALAQLTHALISVIPIAPNATGIPYAAAAAVIYQTTGLPLEILATAVGLRFLLTSAVFWTFFLAVVGIRRSPQPIESKTEA